LDPPEEYGVLINLGNSNVGKGKPVVKTKKTAPPKEVKKEVVEEKVESNPQKTIKEEVITNNESKEVISKPKEPKKEQKKVEEKPKKEVVKPKPKPSKATKDALNSLLNSNNKDGNPKGEGDDDKDGIKGKANGSDISKKYYGNIGSGGGNYNLAGRNALIKPKEQPDCQEEGIVVVEITVDRAGNVIRAVPGAKGTNNTAPCLMKPAKEAALKTKWNNDQNAPSIQKGTIIYKFSLTQ
tara:strand:- start:30258 stop:30974 length:717 start_codon:yes stop_codon:yes gene_type:complete